MIGETQVMGQFKTFLSSLDREQHWLNRLGQRLLADAREIRPENAAFLAGAMAGSAAVALVDLPAQLWVAGSKMLVTSSPRPSFLWPPDTMRRPSAIRANRPNRPSKWPR